MRQPPRRGRSQPRSERAPLLALLFGMILLLGAPPAAGQEAGTVESPDPALTPSTIVSTTLYASSARVTRQVALPAAVGLHTVRVGPLPAQLSNDSIQAEGATHHRVISVQVERRSGGDQASPAFRALESEYEEKFASRLDLVRRRDAAIERRERYRSLSVVPPNPPAAADGTLPAPVEPTRWQHFIDLVSRGMESAWTEAVGYEAALEPIDRELERLAAELHELRAPVRRQSATAIVTVQNLTGAAGTLDVSYELSNALWYPEYSVRIDPAARRLEVSCYGVVHQATGEDWPETPVRFSTSIPQAGATMPELASHRIRRDRYQDYGTFARDEDGDWEEDSLADARGYASSHEMRRSSSRARGRSAGSPPPPTSKKVVAGMDRFRFADASGESSSFIDLPREAAEGVRTYGGVEKQARFPLQGKDQKPSHAPPQIHDVPGHATPPTLATSRGFLRTFTSIHPEPVPSDGAPHRLLIGRIELPFTEERTAVPELAARVFRRLRAPLTGADPCLAGSAAVFLDGAYLGLSRVPTTAPGEELILDLGVDEQVEIVRRQEDREEEVGVFSKARRYLTTVTLEVTNHHAEAKTIDLRERMPFTEEERISIDLDDDDTRPRPSNVNETSGLIDWALSVPAGETRTVTLRYSIDAPRAFQLTRTPAPQRLEEDDR